MKDSLKRLIYFITSSTTALNPSTILSRSGWIALTAESTMSLNQRKLVVYATPRAVIAAMTSPTGETRNARADAIALTAERIAGRAIPIAPTANTRPQTATAAMPAYSMNFCIPGESEANHPLISFRTSVTPRMAGLRYSESFAHRSVARTSMVPLSFSRSPQKLLRRVAA